MSLRGLVSQNKPKELRKAFRRRPKCGEMIDIHGQTILMFAIRQKRPECAKVIASITSKSFINLKERANRGSTALHLAVKNNYYDLVRYLVKKGANPKIYDAESHTSLSLAAGKHRKDIRLFLSSILSNAWRRTYWSPKIHLGAPPTFRKEVLQFVRINWKLKLLSRDTMGIMFEWLLELHRHEIYDKKCEYFYRCVESNNILMPNVILEAEVPVILEERNRCVGITNVGERCKQRIRNGINKCWRHLKLRPTLSEK